MKRKLPVLALAFLLSLACMNTPAAALGWYDEENLVEYDDQLLAEEAEEKKAKKEGIFHEDLHPFESLTKYSFHMNGNFNFSSKSTPWIMLYAQWWNPLQ